MRKTILLATCLVAVGISGCVSTPFDVAGNSPALEMRSIQTREYESLDKTMAMRAVVATLQDLGFTIDQADIGVGVITGTRLEVMDMRMTITVAPKAAEWVSVRANARVGEKSITEAATYQDFFVALDKAVFLTRNNIN
jgi:hypothetical protein